MRYSESQYVSGALPGAKTLRFSWLQQINEVKEIAIAFGHQPMYPEIATWIDLKALPQGEAR
jgi:hypothetical protein